MAFHDKGASRLTEASFHDGRFLFLVKRPRACRRIFRAKPGRLYSDSHAPRGQESELGVTLWPLWSLRPYGRWTFGASGVWKNEDEQVIRRRRLAPF